ncbi:trimeric intracellular cation channel family protein [Pseudorhodoferax sp.]|uniref:trimeric intracellular cation channel family protein n=1 Tax=Pseudorhodoferax sp. TaxID=1993553 RepID=UPI002DD6907F|nr:trimeric intracellular cation channel family protein [Pseudorhodoferax sp.]
MSSLPLGQVLTLSNAQVVVEAAATVAFAASGLLAAARKRLDAVGVCIVSGLAAFGGGTLRDVLLDRRPFFWVEHAGWLWALLALCVAAMLFMHSRHFAATERAMQWPDAFGLGLFAASGTQIALQAGTPAVVAVLMGTMTAVFGGVLRDIVCNEIPRAFSDHQPYAVCAFAGAWVVVLGHRLDMDDWLGMVSGAATALLLRALALWTGWTLPSWNTGEPPRD